MVHRCGLKEINMATNDNEARDCDLAEEIFEDNRYFDDDQDRGRRDGLSPEVLLAEDDDDMRRLVRNALREEGFHVLEARSGWELLGLIGSRMLARGGQPLDLIVTDVRMQGITGIEILEGLREGDWSTPVVLMTAFGDPKLHAEASRLGALAVFDKPFDLRALRRLVRPWAR
jgi:DNA-binding NtrC family response regulator